ncbi:hypothetical protein OROMI_022485 [Orobanche minor]
MQNPQEFLKEIIITEGFGGDEHSPSPTPTDSPYYEKNTKSHLSFMKMLSNPFKYNRESSKSSSRSRSTKLVHELPPHNNPKDEKKLVDSFRELLYLENRLKLKHFDDHTLLRFLRTRGFDLMKANDAFTQYIKWREEFGVDAVLEEFKFGEYQKVKKCYPHGFHGVDRYGRPVYIGRIGMVDLDTLLHATTIERFVRYHVREQEMTMNSRYPSCSLSAKKRISSTLSVLDVKGVGMSQFSKPARYIFMEIQKIDSCYYPDTLDRLFIINAGSGFKVLWKAISAFLDVRTLAKIQVLGSDYRSSLIEAIDPSNLPSFLGGECTCSEYGGCLFSDKGPWNDPGDAPNKDRECQEEKVRGERKNVDKPLSQKIQEFEDVLEDAKEKLEMLGVALSDAELLLQEVAQHIEE